MSLLCTLKNIRLSFGPKIIFDNAQISVSVGDRIGLLGLNGKGKSTLFKILTGDIVPDHSSPPFEFNKARGDVFHFFTYLRSSRLKAWVI
jgi:ATP-binding cassette subfamily F protein uup